MLNRSRILLVDDEETFIRLEERILQERYITRSVRSGAEALTEVHRFHPDLILLDIAMPKMNGFETCRRLRENHETEFMKIFMVSGRNSVEERLAGYNAGADDYIVKPFAPEEFLAKVETSLRLRRAEEIEHIKSTLLALLSVKAQESAQRIIELTGTLIDAHETPEHISTALGHMLRSSIEFSHFAGKAARLYELQQGAPLHISKAPLRDHLLAVVNRWRAAIDFSGLDLTLTCPEDLALDADWCAMDEVFEYLLDNAIRYSISPSTISVTATCQGDDCRIAFVNHGKGIPSELIDALFTPFFVEDIRHHHRGHGLSLSIANALVARLRGRILVSSNPDGETVFTIEIPMPSTSTVPEEDE